MWLIPTGKHADGRAARALYGVFPPFKLNLVHMSKFSTLHSVL
jgi:hypothetical protein